MRKNSSFLKLLGKSQPLVSVVRRVEVERDTTDDDDDVNINLVANRELRAPVNNQDLPEADEQVEYVRGAIAAGESLEKHENEPVNLMQVRINIYRVVNTN